MAVSRPIQKHAGGLLDFLQIKNAGKNPSDLPDSIQPVLEMRDWLWQTYAEMVAGTDAAITAFAPVDKITVPANEWWALHEAVATATLVAAATLDLAPYYRMGPAGSANNFPIPLADPLDTPWAEATNSASYFRRMTHPIPLLLPPGAILGIRPTNISANTTAGNLIVRITRMKA